MQETSRINLRREMPMTFVDEDGGIMDVALWCTGCGTPASSGRFCITCGAALSGHSVETESAPGGPALEGLGGATATMVLAPTETLMAPASSPLWQESAATPTQGRTAVNILAILILGALALSGWALMHGAERHILTGTVLLVDSAYDELDPETYCTGSDGYSDIRAGTQVVLTDGKGTTLSTARLSDGEFDGKGCVFSFALHNVKHAEFYALAVAGQNRGELQYSYDELARDDWSLQLSLGDD
jgi:hypothetical protein